LLAGDSDIQVAAPPSLGADARQRIAELVFGVEDGLARRAVHRDGHAQAAGLEEGGEVFGKHGRRAGLGRRDQSVSLSATTASV
jgi:hypothetical protein